MLCCRLWGTHRNFNVSLVPAEKWKKPGEKRGGDVEEKSYPSETARNLILIFIALAHDERQNALA